MDLPIIVKRLALSCEIFLQQNVKSDLFKPIKKYSTSLQQVAISTLLGL